MIRRGIMLKKLQEKNTEISVYTIFDNEFNTFGRVINNIDTSEIIAAGETFEMVEGISYEIVFVAVQWYRRERFRKKQATPRFSQ